MEEYKESLPSGGDLVVSENRWCIKYYFPGPDMRYNGTFVTIEGSQIDQYISAWQNNFKKYLTIKSSLKLDGSYDNVGEAGMHIRIGGYWDGVCIDYHHMNTNKQEKIDQIIRDYRLAKERATQIQQLLKAIK